MPGEGISLSCVTGLLLLILSQEAMCIFLPKFSDIYLSHLHYPSLFPSLHIIQTAVQHHRKQVYPDPVCEFPQRVWGEGKYIQGPMTMSYAFASLFFLSGMKGTLTCPRCKLCDNTRDQTCSPAISVTMLRQWAKNNRLLKTVLPEQKYLRAGQNTWTQVQHFIFSKVLFQNEYRIFLDQASNRYLLHWQANSLPLSHQRSPQVHYFF